MKEEHKVHEKEIKEVNHEELPVDEVEQTLPVNTCCPGKKCNCRNIKMAIIIAILVILGSLAYYYRSCFISATVNGTPISRFDVMREAEKQKGKEILDGLIVKQLIRDEALKQKIRVTKADITAEITKIETQLKTQNTTLDAVLKEQGMTRVILEQQIILQKQVEKMVTGNTPVTDKEALAYIEENKIVIPEEQKATALTEIKTKMAQDKFNQMAGAFVASLKDKASIKYLVSY